MFIYFGTESKWLKWLAVVLLVFLYFGTESKWLKWLGVGDDDDDDGYDDGYGGARPMAASRMMDADGC